MSVSFVIVVLSVFGERLEFNFVKDLRTGILFGERLEFYFVKLYSTRTGILFSERLEFYFVKDLRKTCERLWKSRGLVLIFVNFVKGLLCKGEK